MEGCQNKQNNIEQFDPDFSIPIIVLHSLSSICAILLNAVVLLTVWKTPSLQTPSRILLCSLAFSDFCMGFISQPLFVIYCVAALQEWTDIFCSIWVVNLRLGYCLAGISFGTLTFIGLDRCLAIKTKMSYKSLVTSKRVLWLVVCGWVLSIASISLAIQYFPFRTCLLIGSVLIVIGLLIITVSYSLSFLALKRLSLKVSCSETYSTAQNNLKSRALTDQSTLRKHNITGIHSTCTKLQENKQSTSKQSQFVIKSASINKTPSNDQSASVNQENQSATVNLENQSASVIQHSQSASLDQDKHLELASTHQDTQSTSSRLQASKGFNVLKYKRSLMTMLMVLALTLLFYLPLICHAFISSLITIKSSIVFSHFSQFIVAFNSTVNPLFYLWRMKDLRIATYVMLRSIISKVRC